LRLKPLKCIMTHSSLSQILLSSFFVTWLSLSSFIHLPLHSPLYLYARRCNRPPMLSPFAALRIGSCLLSLVRTGSPLFSNVNLKYSRILNYFEMLQWNWNLLFTSIELKSGIFLFPFIHEDYLFNYFSYWFTFKLKSWI
jgi:hypothetical protein